MRIISTLCAGAFLITLMSCSDSQSPQSVSDKSEIRGVIESFEQSDTLDYFYDNIDDGSTDNFGNEPNFDDPFNLHKPITPWRFGRIATNFNRNISVDLTSDTTATIYLDRILDGHFIIVAQDTDSTGQVGTIYQKDMRHHIQRVVQMQKKSGSSNEDRSRRRRWHLIDFSMALGVSESDNSDRTVNILELKIAPSQGDTVVISDPLNYFMARGEVFEYSRGTEVTLTITVQNTTSNPIYFPDGTKSTEWVRLHYGLNRKGHRGRKPFEWIGQDQNGNNIYQGTWRIAQRRGVHHAVIDVIDNGTIFDSDESVYPYNSVTWGTPYYVRPF